MIQSVAQINKESYLRNPKLKFSENLKVQS